MYNTCSGVNSGKGRGGGKEGRREGGKEGRRRSRVDIHFVPKGHRCGERDRFGSTDVTVSPLVS